MQTGMLMEVTFPQYDVRFIAINDGVDSADGTNDYAGIRNYFNDLFARDTSKKIRAVQRAKGERGERIGSVIAYGYMKNPDDPKQLLPDPETAPIVKRIFEMYADGIGIMKICDKLCAEKVLSPSVYAFRKTGRRTGRLNPDKPYHWDQKSVRLMLSNRVYCGDTVNFKTYTKSNKLKKRIKNDEENVLIFENTHEPIVDRKTFDLVQKHFDGRKRPDRQGEMDKYAGYLYCGDCGKRLYLQRAKTKAVEKNSFICGGYQKRTTDCTCHHIREQVLDQIVLENLKAATAFARDNPEEFYAMAAKNGEVEARRLCINAEREKEQITARIKQLDSIIRCLYEDRVTGRITSERYDTLASGYEQEQSHLRLELESISHKISEMDMREQYIQKFIATAKEYIESHIVRFNNLRVLELKEYVIKILAKGFPQQTSHIFKNKHLRSYFTDGTDSLREHIPFIVVRLVLAAKRKRLARRSSGNKLYLAGITIIMHSAHIGLIYIPISDGRIPMLNVVIQIVAGILVPFVKSRMIEPGQLKSESETTGPAEEFNRVHHMPFPILSIVTTMLS